MTAWLIALPLAHKVMLGVGSMVSYVVIAGLGVRLFSTKEPCRGVVEYYGTDWECPNWDAGYTKRCGPCRTRHSVRIASWLFPVTVPVSVVFLLVRHAAYRPLRVTYMAVSGRLEP